ncbi:MAG TPA: hypothetical protein VK892_04800 [Pyrinomonadaceae bacterium]|nr:hypothetical protein [Pyrinomonadaceae bacterium]
MEKTQSKTSGNGAKPRSKALKEKKEFTEAEMRLIKASRAVMKVIEKQVERGDFDEYLNAETEKI